MASMTNGDTTTMMMKKNKTLKIACCSVPHSGHMNPIMSLVQGLVSKRDNVNNNEDYYEYTYEICVFTFGEDGHTKYQKQCDELKVDIIISHIDGLHTNEDMIKLDLDSKKFPFPTFADRWKPLLEKKLDKFQPNIIVCDFMTLNPQEYAHKHNVTLVINTPGPMHIIPAFTLPVNLEGNGGNGSAIALGGLYISFKAIDLFGYLSFFNIKDWGNFTKRTRTNIFGNNNTIVLVNSFWGLEKPRLFVPPNIMMVGPIMPPLRSKLDFSRTHPVLHTFLVQARNENKKVLLVTTGSLIRMEEWLVKLLYNAFCNLNNNCVIVWSLKQDQQKYIINLNEEHNSKFHFSSWLPQPSLLASDFIDGVITHCGWGGTLECIAGGKPIGVLPFFGDQPGNAQLLLDTGCATSLGHIPKFNGDSSGQSAYKNDGISITQEGITQGCHRLLEESTYSEKAKRLQSLACDNPNMGCTAACDQIILALHNGVSHLCDSTKYLQLTGHRPFAFTSIFGVITIAAAYGARVFFFS